MSAPISCPWFPRSPPYQRKGLAGVPARLDLAVEQATRRKINFRCRAEPTTFPACGSRWPSPRMRRLNMHVHPILNRWGGTGVLGSAVCQEAAEMLTTEPL